MIRIGKIFFAAALLIAFSATAQVSGTNNFDLSQIRYANRFAGSDMCAQIVAAMNDASTTGAQIFVPAGTYVCTTQLLVPNNGATPPTQKSYRITGVGNSANGQGGAPNGGTILDLQNNAATAKIDTRGLGYLEIDHITLEDTAADCAAFVFTTNTTLMVHNVEFYGTASAGSACNDALILGGTGTVFDGSSSAPFQGYGTVIQDNYANKIQRFIKGQTYANGIVISSNTIWSGSGFATGGAIEFTGIVSSSDTGNVITGNLIEVSNYKYGVRGVNYFVNNYIAGNNCYDPTATHTACTRFETNANYNTVVDGYRNDTYAGISDVGNTNTFLTSHQSQTSVMQQPFTFNGNPFTLASGSSLCWDTDTGVTRSAADTFNFGNCSGTDFSGILKAGVVTITGETQPASIGTTPGTSPTTVMTITGATGGNTSIATTGAGGIGSAIAFTSGTGGQATAAATAATGGNGGAYSVTVGTGGAAGIAGTGSNTGGMGGTYTATAGAGGAANGNTSGTNAGGVGGGANLTGGTGGGATVGSGNLNGGNGGAAQVMGGTAGVGATTPGTGGTATVQGGSAAASAGSAGGIAALTGGNGTATGSGGAGGAININAGTAQGDGTSARAGGNITINGGSSKGNTGAGGRLLLTGGTAGDNPASGTASGPAGGNSSMVGTTGGTANSASTASTGGGGGLVAINGATGGAATVAGTGTNNGGVGGATQMLGGTGGAATAASSGTNTGGAGGGTSILGGTGGAANSGSGTNTAGGGGNITIRAGAGGLDGGSGGGSGAVTIAGGTAPAAAGGSAGSVSINGGTASTTGTGGIGANVTITGSNAGGDQTVNRGGGGITLTMGNSKGGSAAGTLTVNGGTAGDNQTAPSATGGQGASYTFSPGVGGTASLATTASTGGAGGDTTWNTATGGAASVAGTGTNTGGRGGNLSYTAGTGGAANGATSGTNTGGKGGSITFTAGTGGGSTAGSGTLTAGAGGLVEFLGGNAGAGATTNINGGSVNITGGTPTNSGSAGNVMLGITSGGTARGKVGIATNSPGDTFDVATKFTVSSNGVVTKYNNDTTVGNGSTAQVATIDLTAQQAAIAATNLIASPSTSLYRVCYVATVTQASSTSSILGGSNGFQITYVDNDDSVTKTLPGAIVAGVDTNANNSTATSTVSQCHIANVKTGTAIQYKFDYSSTGVTPMQYNLHIRAERL